ncbi:glycosyltransferase family 4 protein [Ornithinimicrobium faecis]|uniref:glycosyltransferase family 4 protein n=1 Tax=Ornithinimicrobium faecis TaxID=2934158 RepID=UPI002118425E|nr:glycosyltransferase family 4 protein [Ornithinimicrobium sp. HY1745]
MAAADSTPTLTPPPVDGDVLSTTEPQHLVALAHNAAEFTRVRHHLRGLTWAGHQVVLVWLEGDPDGQLDFVAQRRIRPGLVRSTAGLRQLISTPREHWRGDRTNLVDASRLDPAVLRLLDWADGVMAFGDQAKEALQDVIEGRSVRVPHKDLRGWAGLGLIWQDFRAASRAGVRTAEFADELADRVTLLQPPAPDEVQEEFTTFLAGVARAGHHREALRLLPYLQLGQADWVELARRQAVFAYVHTSAAGREHPDLRDSAAALLPAIDSLLETDLERAATLTTLALGLLFHVELHADKLTTPLVEDPDSYLHAWRDSRVGQALARPVPRPPAPHSAAPHPPTPHPQGEEQPHGEEQPQGEQQPRRVIALRGSYPRFSAQVVEELRARPGTEVVEHTWTGRSTQVTGLGIRLEPVEARLRQAMGEDVPDPELATLFDGADAVFIDWADRGACVALMQVPAGVHVTLRIHSMDALSPWIHLIDWSRVDDLVLVSEHLRDVVQRLLGDRLSSTTVHVVANAVDPARIPTDKTPGHLRRLLVIGWAQPVKDPLWALEVLSRLRQHDPQWTLVLVGSDFLPSAVTSGVQYAEAFRARLTEPDVCGGVEFVSPTSEITPHLRSAGFVLSTSRRESFGLGLVEGAASGAVPVVRNWPIFAALDGARRLFPQDWVVDSVDSAVERILEHADEPAWQRGSEAARGEVEQRFLADAPALALSRIILGEGPA